MSRCYSVAEVVEMLGWPYRRGSKVYQRVYQAVCVGEAGPVSRMGRGWVLSQKNVEQLTGYLRDRWPDLEPAAVAK